MKMRLLIDQGNSYLKWAVRADSTWTTGRVRATETGLMGAELAKLFTGNQTPSQILLSSVAGKESSAELCSWLRDRFAVEPSLLIPTDTAFGVKNEYLEPGTLGADRWAALIAVRNRYQLPACIVDCGTAVTIDLLDQLGDFKGGTILPGLGLSRQSLATSTARLHLDAEADYDCVATSTASAIASGTLMGLAGGIDRILECQRAKLGSDIYLYLTGGDAGLVARELKQSGEIIDDLVLQGLDVVAGGQA